MLNLSFYIWWQQQIFTIKKRKLHSISFLSSLFFSCGDLWRRLVKIESLTKYLVLFVLMLLFDTFTFFYQLNQPAALGEIDLAFLRQSCISVLALFMLKVGGFAWLIFTGNLWEWNQSCWGLGSTVYCVQYIRLLKIKVLQSSKITMEKT